MSNALPEALQAIKDAESWDAAKEAATNLLTENALLVHDNRDMLDIDKNGEITPGEIVEAMGHQKPEEEQTASCGCSR